MKDFKQFKYSTTEGNSKDNKLTKLGWGLFLFTISGLALLLLANLFGLPGSRTVVTSYKTLAQGFTTPGLIIRKEVVTMAPCRGTVNIKVPEGTRVGVGEHILTLFQGNQASKLYNYESGIISYELDGLEDTLKPNARNKLTYDQFKNLEPQKRLIKDGTHINTGQPVFKVINNFKFYLAVLLPQEKLAEYEAGARVEVVFSQLKNTTSFVGQVDRIIPDKPKNIMIIKLTKFVPQLINLRKTKVKVIKNRYQGLVIPEKALVKRKKTIGVKIRGQVQDYFKEVEVEQKIRDKAIIDGVLPGVKVIID